MPTLEWLNKSQAVQAATKVQYHLLSVQSVHGDETTENLLIQGDNLLALKALLPTHRGRVKCIFIDPPYNTKSAFTHYNDKLEHSLWLTMMLPRLQLLRDLLSQDGSIWVTIDDNEGHYLKVLMDEVLGRREFLANLVWQSKDTPGNNSTGLAQTHNQLLAYRRSESFCPNLLSRNEKQIATYKNPDNDPNGPWLGTPLTRAEHRDRDYYPLKNKAGREVLPPKGSSWRRPPDKLKHLELDGRIYWGKDGNSEFPMEKKYLSEVKEGVVNQTWWPYDFAGSTRNASAELKGIFEGEKSFDTPKPEKLIYRILELATNPGDLILDSFLGSGTTAAVAHKMGRRWIGIEKEQHAVTHCLPRMQKVVEGEQGGISKAVSWQGGGGFKFLTLGNAIFDDLGRIHIDVKFADLAAFVWQQETQTPASRAFTTPYLGEHRGTAYFLLFNGILGDERPDGGNVLTYEVLDALHLAHPFSGPRVIFGEACKLPPSFCTRNRLTFKKIPYSLRGQGVL